MSNTSLSGFTIIKNAIKLQYPIIESINSLLPYVDEYIINAGNSDDQTDKLLADNFADNPKVKIFKSVWEDKEQGMAFFRNQTNKALDRCSGEWCFYLQADEVVQEREMSVIRSLIDGMDVKGYDAGIFDYYHFCEDYNHIFKTYSEGFDMYEKEVRLIKNNKEIRSTGDAMGFVGIKNPYMMNRHIYHYGYVRDRKIMLEKKLYLKDFYFSDPTFTEVQKELENGKIRSDENGYKFTKAVNIFEGNHPKVMQKLIEEFNNDNIR